MTISDFCAIGAATGCADRGLHVPADMSVTGFGDHLIAEYFRVPLTTVRQPKYGVGLAAAEHMVHLLRGEKPEPKLLNAELVVRGSTASPKLPKARPMAKEGHAAVMHGDELQ
jgi:LacI family transcriptional regulator